MLHRAFETCTIWLSAGDSDSDYKPHWWGKGVGETSTYVTTKQHSCDEIIWHVISITGFIQAFELHACASPESLWYVGVAQHGHVWPCIVFSQRELPVWRVLLSAHLGWDVSVAHTPCLPPLVCQVCATKRDCLKNEHLQQEFAESLTIIMTGSTRQSLKS